MNKPQTNADESDDSFHDKEWERFFLDPAHVATMKTLPRELGEAAASGALGEPEILPRDLP